MKCCWEKDTCHVLRYSSVSYVLKYSGLCNGKILWPLKNCKKSCLDTVLKFRKYFDLLKVRMTSPIGMHEFCNHLNWN